MHRQQHDIKYGTFVIISGSADWNEFINKCTFGLHFFVEVEQCTAFTGELSFRGIYTHDSAYLFSIRGKHR